MDKLIAWKVEKWRKKVDNQRKELAWLHISRNRMKADNKDKRILLTDALEMLKFQQESIELYKEQVDILLYAIHRLVETTDIELLRTKEGCHAGKDGDCEWSNCPQLKDRQSYCILVKVDHNDYY